MTGRSLEAVLHPARGMRPASLGIEVQGFDYDHSQHSNGTTLLVKGVAAADLRSLAAQLLDLAKTLPIEQPLKTGRNSWTYKGWSFHQRADGTFFEYHIHGPNSNGKRARKIVFSYDEAVKYVDERVS